MSSIMLYITRASGNKSFLQTTSDITFFAIVLRSLQLYILLLLLLLYTIYRKIRTNILVIFMIFLYFIFDIFLKHPSM